METNGHKETEINVSHTNLGTINKNCVTISTNKGSVDLYFSYTTIVGVNGLVSVNDWSNTTGKLLNELEPDKERRVSHEEVLKEVNRALQRVLYSEKELIEKAL